MSTDLKMLIAARIREARKHAGLSQEELAARIDRHKDSLSLIERGETVPTLPMMLSLASALEIPIQDLLPQPEVQQTLSPRRVKVEAEIFTIVRSLPESRLDYVREQLRLLSELP